MQPTPQGDVSVARRFFSALSSESPGSRAALQEAVGSLAGAYALAAQKSRKSKGGKGEGGEGAEGGGAAAGAPSSSVEGDLQELLLSSLGSDQAAVRLCAIQVGQGLGEGHRV